MNLPEVSIVVPVYNGAQHIAPCIENLLALDYPEEKREIIIVDNGSTDRTAEIASSYPVRLLSENRRGVACARNTGWRAAQFDLIAFTDCDCCAEKNWLSALVPHFEDATVGGCGGKLKPAKPHSLVEEYVIYKDILTQERAMRDEPISPPFIITANAMYRKSVLEEVEGFDESFTVAGEDADLSWRVAWKGYKIIYEPEANVVHHHRSTLWGLLMQVRAYGMGSSYLFWKHRRRLGYNSFIVHKTYRELVGSFFKAPFHLVFKRGRLKRLIPALDFLGGLFFLSGKITTSLKLRVGFF
jgi:cellulose synthase/poly-beta-1,6-N-acetylglucosamine synthase-like glycosyltransferase